MTWKTSSGTVTKRLGYDYDVFDRRIAKKADYDLDGTFETQDRFIYDGDNIALVFDAYNSLTTRYLHGVGTDQVLAEERVSTGERHWMLGDNLGSVRDVAADDGTVLDHVVYDAFGAPASQTNSAYMPRYGFAGREFDADSYQYYNRARYHDMYTGRFLSQDPIAFGGGDDNLYRYVKNSPVNASDPSRLTTKNSEPGRAASTGGIIGAGGQLADAGTLRQMYIDFSEKLRSLPANQATSLARDALKNAARESGGALFNQLTREILDQRLSDAIAGGNADKIAKAGQTLSEMKMTQPSSLWSDLKAFEARANAALDSAKAAASDLTNSIGNPAKTNAAVNAIADNMKWVGREAIIVGVVSDGIDIYNATLGTERSLAIGRAVSRWAGELAGAEVGGALGLALGGPIGGIVGGLAGGIGGALGANWSFNSVVSFLKS